MVHGSLLLLVFFFFCVFLANLIAALPYSLFSIV